MDSRAESSAESSADFERFLEVLLLAQETDPAELDDLLERECADDPGLRLRVERHLPFGRAAARIAEERFLVLGAFEDAPPEDRSSAGRFAPGSSMGPFRITEVLGEGGMGIVYLAEQLEPVRRQVAVKAIKPGMDTREVLARFDAERQALARMSHPAIAQVYDAGSTGDGRPYFVMEYVPGTAITEHCDAASLGVRERLELFVQVCHGVEHAHQKNVLHRDLKPSNVLVTMVDQKPLVKIIDFGVAKATEEERLSEETVATELGRAIGTPGYMSPERAGGATADVRSDVYSLGALLYELLVGGAPLEWDGLRKASIDEVLRAVREKDPLAPSARWGRLGRELRSELACRRRIAPSALLRELRGELDWIVLKALAKERERRYGAALDLAADIERHLRGEPVVAGPPGVFYRARRALRRHRGPVAAVAAVLFVLLAGLVASLVLYVRAEDHARRVLQLSDVKRLSDYRKEAETLWPAVPERVPDMEDWLLRARSLLSRVDEHRAVLASLRERAEAPDAAPGGSSTAALWTFADTETEWWHDTLAQLVDDLDAFGDRDPFRGTVASVEKRLEFARTVRRRSVEEHEAAWREVIESVRAGEGPYRPDGIDGPELRPQVGLVPLGRDPASGLFEFGHLQTGRIPTRGSAGELVLDEDTGLVFVLLPGGRFLMGAEPPSEDPGAAPARVDPHAEEKEGPVHEIDLEPFLISKYEMTQGQWRRFTGKNPSVYGPGSEFGGRRQDLRHPVENVSWEMCRDVLGRLGLDLPTEAQWEYAAGGGSNAVWWTGDAPRSLAGAANLADRYCELHGGPPTWQYEEWDDGYVVHAPAGSFRPNDFGLHGIHGNVKEWCRDRYAAPYELPARAGDGEREVADDAPERVIRGGSFDVIAVKARLATRNHGTPVVRSMNLGVRPVWRIQE